MILIVCVDDDNGMMFNHRRQSQDHCLRSHILAITTGKRLWMDVYSAGQFSIEETENIDIDDYFLSKAAVGDYCFVEDLDVSKYENLAEKVILYRWNRKYPGDLFFSIPLQDHGWKLIKSTDFAGSSHDKITEEIYSK